MDLTGSRHTTEKGTKELIYSSPNQTWYQILGLMEADPEAVAKGLDVFVIMQPEGMVLKAGVFPIIADLGSCFHPILYFLQVNQIKVEWGGDRQLSFSIQCVICFADITVSQGIQLLYYYTSVFQDPLCSAVLNPK